MCICAYHKHVSLDDIASHEEVNPVDILRELYEYGLNTTIKFSSSVYFLSGNNETKEKVKYLLDFDCDEKDLNTQLGEVYYHFGDLFEFAEIE